MAQPLVDLTKYTKERYGELTRALEDEHTLQKMLRFKAGTPTPQGYVEPTTTQWNHGITYYGQGKNVLLRPAVSEDAVKAVLYSTQSVMRTQVSYDDLYRQSEEGASSFVAANRQAVLGLTSGHRRALEISILHGRSPYGIGTVASLSSQVITLNRAYFAPGIYAGSLGMKIDVFQADGVTPRQLGLVISDMDPTVPSITVTGTTTGIASTDIIYPDCQVDQGTTGTPATAHCQGLINVASKTRADTLYGITMAGQILYTPTQYVVGGAFKLSHVLTAFGNSVFKGVTGNYVLLVAPETWASFNEAFSNVRVTDSSYSNRKMMFGTKALEITAGNATVNIMAHAYMTPGLALALPYGEADSIDTASVIRIGSCDMDFMKPGGGAAGSGGEILFHMQASTAVEMRTYSDQTPFVRRPGRVILFTGIVNPA